MKKNVLLLTTFVIFLAILSTKAKAWYYEGWQYRKPIIVSEQSGVEQFNYTVCMQIPYDSNMQSSFDDLRFTYYNETSDQEIEIPFCIGDDCIETYYNGEWKSFTKVDSSYADVCVKVPYLPAGGNSTIYMYYGNPSATSVSNKYEVWLYATDLEDCDTTTMQTCSLKARTWTRSPEIVLDGTKVLKLIGDNWDGTGNLWTVYIPIEWGDVLLTMKQKANNQDPGSWVYNENDDVQIGGRLGDNVGTKSISVNSPSGGSSKNTPWSVDSNIDRWHKHRYYAFGNKNDTFIHCIDEGGGTTGTDCISRADSAPYSGQKFTIRFYIAGNKNRPGYAHFDNIVFRKIADPEPSYWIGEEEIPNPPPQIIIHSPLNQTYFSNAIELKFKVLDDSSSTLHVKAWFEDELIYENSSYQNSTSIIISLKPYITQAGTFIVKVWADDMDPTLPQTNEEMRHFTIKAYEVPVSYTHLTLPTKA